MIKIAIIIGIVLGVFFSAIIAKAEDPKYYYIANAGFFDCALAGESDQREYCGGKDGRF